MFGMCAYGHEYEGNGECPVCENLMTCPVCQDQFTMEQYPFHVAWEENQIMDTPQEPEHVRKDFYEQVEHLVATYCPACGYEDWDGVKSLDYIHAENCCQNVVCNWSLCLTHWPMNEVQTNSEAN